MKSTRIVVPFFLLTLALACAANEPVASTPPTTASATPSATSTATSTSSKCPASPPSAGAACASADDSVCAYGPSTSCRCTMTSCVTPAGPVPGCTSKPVWECRSDGCPVNGTGACSSPGKQCTMDDGMCAQTIECRNGSWAATGQPSCRPAAPR